LFLAAGTAANGDVEHVHCAKAVSLQNIGVTIDEISYHWSIVQVDETDTRFTDTRFTINEKGADDMEEDALSKRLGKKASKASTTTNDS
jgi:hypothetical protein